MTYTNAYAYNTDKVFYTHSMPPSRLSVKARYKGYVTPSWKLTIITAKSP